ncbi:BREX-1 system adenine-specific DNA-methyltransferase PglX [Neobacillus sp. NPDC093182]|uniref:BREX-1 system adenine-specific DNA-methyltransferase PglX n=1 Tax=Neobacillus sp. NPDC093182 TaxID=3364297 RepID=UPI0038070C72
MDKSAIKNFATSARVKLMGNVMQNAYELGITKDDIKEPEIYQDGFRIGERLFNKNQKKQYDTLIAKIREKGYEQVVEEVAYTWFNRFIAIRFMEVNDYLPIGIRILSSQQEGKIEPDVIQEVTNITDDLELDIELVFGLQDENNSEELFKYILIKQCNKLNDILPYMFEKIEDYTELLLPDNLLQEGSVVRDLVTMIPEEDWTKQVEIIGWLYQEYISEKKAEVAAAVKKGNKVSKENLPAKTQIFTPKWIVNYMVENSLGRLWLESHPNEELTQQWKYYLEETEQESEVQEQLEKLKNKELNPEDIKVLDPCMGSGHILVYAFDVLYQIYKEAGYSERDIPRLIIEKNLYGLDIDDRAAQLAYFAIMMKARSYERRIFRHTLEPNLVAIQESKEISKDAIDFFVSSNNSLEIEQEILRNNLFYLIETFKNAKEYGAIIEVTNFDFTLLEKGIEELQNKQSFENIFSIEYRDILLEVILPLIKQAKIMSERFDIIITNPPYMGSSDMNTKLLDFTQKYYPNSKKDMSTVIIEKSIALCKENGYVGMINIPTWMYLSSYEDFRHELLNSTAIINLLHLGRGVFGSDFGTVSFVLKNSNIKNYIGLYKKLFVKKSQVESNEIKKQKFFYNDNVYYNKQIEFKSISGNPIAYNINETILGFYKNGVKISDIADPRQGLATGNNDTFVRLWYEVNFNKIGFEYRNVQEFINSHKLYVPFNKGGKFRKWYGNIAHILKFDKFNYNQLSKSGNKLPSKQYYFKECLTWSKVTIGGISFRNVEQGVVFADSGCSIFNVPGKENVKYALLGLLNSKVADVVMSFLSATVNYEVGHVNNVPVEFGEYFNEIQSLSLVNVNIAKIDWGYNENTWEFKRHPFIQLKGEHRELKIIFEEWQKTTNKNIEIVKQNEERINEIFINLYNLQKETGIEVCEDNITLTKADKHYDIKSFISYAIGCMFGRYSIHKDGLAFAGGDFNIENYKQFSFIVNDNVIPITDDYYFEDDIVSRLIKFLQEVFGDEKLEDNIEFIANSLGRGANETSRQSLRRYFLKDFYKDHIQRYSSNNQKRPIYWLFESGKQDGFKALIYMHRYDESTVAKVRTDYLHMLQGKYEAEMHRQEVISESDVSDRDKKSAKDKKEKLQKQLLECREYDQVIAHVANQRISIDLDDGVKVNYMKFQGVEVPQGEGKKPLMANLLSPIKL